MKITVHNVETGEVITREMNETELAQMAKSRDEFEARIAAQNELQSQKHAILTKLGITENEAKLLLS
jgi:hypothetical protein